MVGLAQGDNAGRGGFEAVGERRSHLWVFRGVIVPGPVGDRVRWVLLRAVTTCDGPGGAVIRRDLVRGRVRPCEGLAVGTGVHVGEIPCDGGDVGCRRPFLRVDRVRTVRGRRGRNRVGNRVGRRVGAGHCADRQHVSGRPVVFGVGRARGRTHGRPQRAPDLVQFHVRHRAPTSGSVIAGQQTPGFVQAGHRHVGQRRTGTGESGGCGGHCAADCGSVSRPAVPCRRGLGRRRGGRGDGIGAGNRLQRGGLCCRRLRFLGVGHLGQVIGPDRGGPGARHHRPDAGQAGRDAFGFGVDHLGRGQDRGRVVRGHGGRLRAGGIAPRSGGRDRCGGSRGRGVIQLAQVNPVRAGARLDAAGGLALGDVAQRFGVGHRGFRAEIPVLRGKVTKILGDLLHRAERILEPLDRAREGAIGHGKDLVRTRHVLARLFSLPAVAIGLPWIVSQSGASLRSNRDDFRAEMWRTPP